MKSFKWMLFAVVIGITLASFGEEVKAAVETTVTTTEVATDASPTGIRGWLIDIALMLAGSMTLVISWVFGFAKSKAAKNDDQKAAWDALEAGVTETYLSLVQDLKAKRPNGISKEEAEELRNHAIESAKQIATGPALQVLKTTALPILHDWVQKIVLQRKTQA